MLMTLELLNWVKDGKYRILILKVLSKRSLLSSELASELNIHRSSTSRILKVMEQKGLVMSVTGSSRTVTYVITNLGKNILEGLKNDS